jgi:hypothetical protein
VDVIDLEQLDKELGLDDDPLDEWDELESLAEGLGLDPSWIDDLRQFTGIAGIAVRFDLDKDRVTAVRKCRDCDNPARPRKSPNGPWPQRCDEHTRARKKHMDAGGSKPRPQYRQCCVTWSLDNPPGLKLCPQCWDARKASRKPVSQREASWLASRLGPSGWNIQGSGWLRE